MSITLISNTKEGYFMSLNGVNSNYGTYTASATNKTIPRQVPKQRMQQIRVLIQILLLPMRVL